MNQAIRLWQWLGFIITGILGVLLHFAYDWLGQNPLFQDPITLQYGI